MTRKNYPEHNEEDEMEEHGSTLSLLKAGIFLAGIAGVAVYFFYGTKSGQHAWKQIGKAAHSAKNKALETAEGLIQTSKEIYDNTTNILEERKEQIKNLDAKDVAGLTKRLHDRWEKTKEDIEETLKKA